MAQEWNIRPRATQCSACSAAFTDGQTYNTRLTFEMDGYTRGDFCESCWDKPHAGQRGYSSWKGVFHTPPAEPDHRVRKETAEELLRNLIEKGGSSRRNVIYILAVMLERQRVFVEREVQQTESGQRLVVYEHKRTGETFAIIDPQLQLAEIETVQHEIMVLLAASRSDADTPLVATPPAS